MDIKQLRLDYEELTGGKPFNGWGEDKILDKMEAFRKENGINEVEVHGLETVKEVEVVEHHKTIQEGLESTARFQLYKQLMNVTPVYLDGVPHAIVNNEYVKYEIAELEAYKKIEKEIKQLIQEKTAEINS